LHEVEMIDYWNSLGDSNQHGICTIVILAILFIIAFVVAQYDSNEGDRS